MTASKVQLVSQRGPISQPIEPRNVVHNRVVPAVTRRCLFGVPDPKDLQDVYQRQLERERQRAINNYGFDVKYGKFINTTTDDSNTSSTTTKVNSNNHNKNNSDFLEVKNNKSNKYSLSINTKVNGTQECNKTNSTKSINVIAKTLSPKKHNLRQRNIKQATITGNVYFLLD